MSNIEKVQRYFMGDDPYWGGSMIRPRSGEPQDSDLVLASDYDALLAQYEAEKAARERVEADTRRLDTLLRESWDLRCFSFCQGEDVGWRVIAHYMAEPRERVVAEVFADDPRAAIDEAVLAAVLGETSHEPL